MNMRWIGTGSGLNPSLGNTSFTVDRGGPKKLLVDCGFTVPPSLLEQDIIGDISDILLTHFHSDHIGGLETIGFYSYFILNRRGEDRLALHVATEEFAEKLWRQALSAGMGSQQDATGKRMDATLDTYFRVHIGKTVSVSGLRDFDFVAMPHVGGMENYGLRIGDDFYYSGDTSILPPHEPRVIFQDCQFGPSSPGDIHIAYDRLRTELPPEVRRKTHLLHLGAGHEKYDPEADGFAGFVLPGQEFELP